MNRQIVKLVAGLMVCYVALFARLNQIQVFDAKKLNKREDNTREMIRDFDRPRGDIVLADGTVVAHSVETDGKFLYQRTYPFDDLYAHVVGSYSLMFGSDGVERRYTDELSGNTTDFRVGGFLDPFNETPNVGTVELSLVASVQEAARAALGTRNGSVVAINPQTGAVLAMWSYPTYNPNLTATNDAEAAKAFKEALDAAPGKPLLARTFRERFFPGSTFKIVTAAGALDAAKITETSPDFPVTTSYTPPLTSRPISNFGGSSCGGTLLEILEVSCNAPFARIGAELMGPQPLIAAAESFGFNEAAPIDLPGTARSAFPTDFGARIGSGAQPGAADLYEKTPQLAQSAIGQYEVAATPLQMALVAASVANDGRVMTPHVMNRILDRTGATVETWEPSVWKESMTPATAEILRRAMQGVVAQGTATAMNIPGAVVGGKTGTAQLGTTPAKSHAWVIGYAGPPNQAPSVAVAVLVEGQPGASEQTGGKVAAPIAKAVMEAALGAQAGTTPNPPIGEGGD